MLNVHGRTIWKNSNRFLSKNEHDSKAKKAKTLLKTDETKVEIFAHICTAKNKHSIPTVRQWLGPVLQPQDLNTLRSKRKLGNIPKYFTVKYEAISLAGKSGLKVVIAPIYQYMKTLIYHWIYGICASLPFCSNHHVYVNKSIARENPAV